jgi:ribosomal-protein-serine acetyltransferase
MAGIPEVSANTEVFDCIAARTSRYSKAGLLDGKDYSGSGIKCFHLVDLGHGWRIASLAWVDDKA